LVKTIEPVRVAKPAYTPYNNTMVPNTKYKYSVFTLLFSEPGLLRELRR
jgi:hypothetical protein